MTPSIDTPSGQRQPLGFIAIDDGGEPAAMSPVMNSTELL